MTSLRPKARASQPDHPPARSRATPNDQESEGNSDSDSVDMKDLHRVKRDLHNRPLLERRTMNGTLRDKSPHGQDRENHAHVRHSTSTLRASSEQPHRHRHRRRRKRSSTESDEGHVYKTAVARESQNALSKPRHTSSRTVVTEQRRSSAPERTSVLKTLGLEPPQRTRSHRVTVSSSSTDARRRSRESEKESGHTQKDKETAREPSSPKAGLRR